jgi:hypothetical protein
MLSEFIELIARIWKADSEMRDRSLLGESEFDKEARRSVACLAHFWPLAEPVSDWST